MTDAVSVPKLLIYYDIMHADYKHCSVSLFIYYFLYS